MMPLMPLYPRISRAKKFPWKIIEVSACEQLVRATLAGPLLGPIPQFEIPECKRCTLASPLLGHQNQGRSHSSPAPHWGVHLTPPYFSVYSIFLIHAHMNARTILLLCGACTVTGHKSSYLLLHPFHLHRWPNSPPTSFTSPPPHFVSGSSKPSRTLALAIRAQPLLHSLPTSNPYLSSLTPIDPTSSIEAPSVAGGFLPKVDLPGIIQNPSLDSLRLSA